MKNYQVHVSIPDPNHPEIKKVRVDFDGGISIEVLNYGATIHSLEIPDKNGKKENVVLNYESLDEYFEDQAYLGCTVGRYANRIAEGKFSINDINYVLPQNHGINHLHGGFEGFNKKVWSLKPVDELDEGVIIALTYLSEDGEEGYPGNLDVEIRYEVKKNELTIEYLAETDQDTIFSPTNHSYFNLSGDFSAKIDDHVLQIDSTRILSKSELIPNGDYLSVENTAFDFRNVRKIGSKPYDDCYVLDGEIVLSHKGSGRQMKVATSFPSVQLYTADYLSEAGLKNRTGVCLETQFYPDSPNHPGFPCTTLRKNQKFSKWSSFSFKLT